MSGIRVANCGKPRGAKPKEEWYKKLTKGENLWLKSSLAGLFWGKLVLPENCKTWFFTMKLDFSPENSNFRQFWANSTLQNIIWHKNLHGVTLFIAFLLSKFMGKGENLYLLALTYKILKKTKKLLFKKGETRFQNAETRFQNA